MELLNGATLQRFVAVGGAQLRARVVRILNMVCGALREAHGIGLIQRDIQPANIMLSAWSTPETGVGCQSVARRWPVLSGASTFELTCVTVEFRPHGS